MVEGGRPAYIASRDEGKFILVRNKRLIVQPKTKGFGTVSTCAASQSTV